MIYLVFILGGVGIFGRSLPVLFFLSGRFFYSFSYTLLKSTMLPSLPLDSFLDYLPITAPPLFEFERANLQDQTEKKYPYIVLSRVDLRHIFHLVFLL